VLSRYNRGDFVYGCKVYAGLSCIRLTLKVSDLLAQAVRLLDLDRGFTEIADNTVRGQQLSLIERINQKQKRRSTGHQRCHWHSTCSMSERLQVDG
jgi:hypothetical protein